MYIYNIYLYEKHRPFTVSEGPAVELPPVYEAFALSARLKNKTTGLTPGRVV